MSLFELRKRILEDDPFDPQWILVYLYGMRILALNAELN